MSGDITVEVQGLEGIRNALNSVIPAHFQGAALQAMLAAAAKPIVDAAKARAPVKTGLMKGDIYSFKDSRSTATSQIRGISVRTGRRATKSHQAAYYWPWIEYGHGVITTDKRSLGTSATGYFGKIVQAYPAHPFMRPAFDSQKLVALQVFEDAAGKQLLVAADKAGYF